MGRSSNPTAPAPPEINIVRRDVLQEGRDALRLMREAYPQLLELEQRFGPEFAANQVAIALARNDAEVQGIEQDFPRFREALLGASPEISAANEALQARLGELGPSEIETELNRVALEELRQGGELSPEDRRNATQTARAGLSARGLAGGRAGVFAEVLNRENFADAREAQRRQFAASVDAYTNNRETSDAAVAGNIFQQSAAFFDPQQRLFGQGGSQVSGTVNPAGSYAPFLGAAQDVGQSNQDASAVEAGLRFDQYRFGVERADAHTFFDRNAQLDSERAAQARKSNIGGAAIGAGGSIAAGLIAAFL